MPVNFLRVGTLADRLSVMVGIYVVFHRPILASFVWLLTNFVIYSFCFSLFYPIISLLYVMPSPAIGILESRQLAVFALEMSVKFLLIT